MGYFKEIVYPEMNIVILNLYDVFFLWNTIIWKGASHS